MSWRDEPMTAKQRKYLLDLLGGDEPPEPLDRLTGGQASHLIDSLRSKTQVRGRESREVQVTDPGVYRHGDDVFLVTWTQDKDHLYAKRLVESAPRLTEQGERANCDFEYASGAVFDLLPSDKMPYEEAKRLTIRYGRCMVCGRKLEAAESVERGIGPYCKRFYGPAQESPSCKRWKGTHRKHDGRPVTGDGEYAYRLEWERCNGPLPPDRVLHHTCGNVWCVEPAHLEPMSQADHVRAHDLGGDKNVGQALKTHCPAGHPYDEANTYHYRGERHCRECRRAAKHRHRYRQADEAEPESEPSYDPGAPDGGWSSAQREAEYHERRMHEAEAQQDRDEAIRVCEQKHRRDMAAFQQWAAGLSTAGLDNYLDPGQTPLSQWSDEQAEVLRRELSRRRAPALDYDRRQPPAAHAYSEAARRALADDHDAGVGHNGPPEPPNELDIIAAECAREAQECRDNASPRARIAARQREAGMGL
jgi:hypothetical protein